MTSILAVEPIGISTTNVIEEYDEEEYVLVELETRGRSCLKKRHDKSTE